MKKYVIVDIDGTVAKIGDRLQYLLQEPKDWDKFYDSCFDDKPIAEIIFIIEMLINTGNYNIVFCTGRREQVRDVTCKWLKDNIAGVVGIETNNNLLLMRKSNDKRHDTIVKPELVKEAGIMLEDIAFILEDRNSMVKKWRELGVKCLQVADGNF